MGVWINKVLGYGVTDFTLPENWEEDVMARAGKFPLRNFYAYCLSIQEEIQKLSSLRPEVNEMALVGFREFLKSHYPSMHMSIADLISFDFEGGVPGTILFIPAERSLSWNRSNNPIDYYEETLRASAEPRVSELTIGIHPYDKGQVPPDVYALLIWLGLERLAPNLKELIHVWWG